MIKNCSNNEHQFLLADQSLFKLCNRTHVKKEWPNDHFENEINIKF